MSKYVTGNVLVIHGKFFNNQKPSFDFREAAQRNRPVPCKLEKPLLALKAQHGTAAS